MEHLHITCASLCLAAALTATAASPWLHRVYSYRPAPGQFVNDLPEHEPGDTEADMLAKAEELLCGDRTPGTVTLGAYGGYIIVGFDHPVANVPGQRDFVIYGNAFSRDSSSRTGSSEPGIIMVSEDTNGNGLPDDPWYELAGSEYSNPATQHSYRITYFRPDPERPADADPDPDEKYISDRTYIRYTTNDPAKPEGYVRRNTFHTQEYWPAWLAGEQTLYYEGACLPDNYVNIGSGGNDLFIQRSYGYGYADNISNDEEQGFDISWAVDAQGNPVHLGGVHFIKVYTAVNQDCGWIGETSTEVCGGEDFHPEAEYTPTGGADGIAALPARPVILSAAGGTLRVRSAVSTQARIYSASGSAAVITQLCPGDNGIDISALPHGTYILHTASGAAKFAVSR